LQSAVSGAAEPATARARRRVGAALPPAFDEWFMKATSPNPEERFERATAMISALAQAVGVANPSPSASLSRVPVPGTINAPAATPPSPAPITGMSHAAAANAFATAAARLPIALSVIAIAIALVGLGVVLLRGGRSAAPASNTTAQQAKAPETHPRAKPRAAVVQHVWRPRQDASKPRPGIF
jgi:serine/threonine-protein kinase